jgi:gliding motility-associated-like protein
MSNSYRLKLLFPRKHICVFLFAISFLFSSSSKAQLNINAGVDVTICPGIGTAIGGAPTASGGLAPYTYSWTPALGLSSATISNPIATPNNYTTYTLTVTDDTGAVKTNQINVSLHQIHYVSAGKDTSICADSALQLGTIYNYSNAGVSYSWSPGLTLNDSTLPQPIASPITTTTYTLTANQAGCTTKSDFVIITFIPTPDIDAGPTITINEGETVTLNATGGTAYIWSPQYTLTYPYSANPNAEPILTTLYTVEGSDPTRKCSNKDTVRVIVIPSDGVIIYNTFTPNNDENNDTWYIGNIHKFPNNTVEVFNRYGKSVYKKLAYDNTWGGKAFGNDLPSGTYFYVLDLGDGGKLYHGTITIIRK